MSRKCLKWWENQPVCESAHDGFKNQSVAYLKSEKVIKVFEKKIGKMLEKTIQCHLGIEMR